MLTTNFRKEILSKYKYDGKKLCQYLKDYKELQNDEEFILSALFTYPQTFMFLNQDLKNNRDFCLKALFYNCNIFPFFKKKFRKDDEFIQIALKRELLHTKNFEYLPKQLKNTKEYALISLLKNKKLYLSFSKKLREDEEICNIAAQDSALCQHLVLYKKDLLTVNFAKQLFKNFPYLRAHIPYNCMDFSLAKDLVNWNDDYILSVPKKFLKDLIISKNFAKKALEDLNNIQYISAKYLTDNVIDYYFEQVEKKNDYSSILLRLDIFDLNRIKEYIPKIFNYFYQYKCYGQAYIDKHICILNDEKKLWFIKYEPGFVMFFEQSPEFLLKAMKTNPDIIDYLEDSIFLQNLFDAYLLDKLDTFKQDYPQYFETNFTNNVKRIVGYLGYSNLVDYKKGD